MLVGDALLLHPKRSRLLQQPIRPEAGVTAAPPDDDVVVEGDAEPPGDVLNLAGHRDVVPGGLRIAGRVVVDQSSISAYRIEPTNIFVEARLDRKSVV